MSSPAPPVSWSAPLPPVRKSAPSLPARSVVAVLAGNLVVAGTTVDHVIRRAAGQDVIAAVVELHGDGEGRGGAEAADVGDLDHDAVLICGLVVEQRAVRDRDRAAGRVDRETPAGVIEQRIGERVAGIGIRRRDHADHGAVGGVLENRIRRQLTNAWRVVGWRRRARRRLAWGWVAAGSARPARGCPEAARSARSRSARRRQTAACCRRRT